MGKAEMMQQTKRDFMTAAAASAFAAAIAPRLANASPADVAAEIRKAFGDKSMSPGRVKIDAPQVAENGLLVPVDVSVESPMTAADHVRSVHIFAEGNPLPSVVTYRFAPEAGRASASTRIRLAQSQNIVAIAEMSDGSLFSTRVEVRVTVGGCGS